jgi:hypothetical protein
MAGTGTRFQSVVTNRAPIPQFATTGIPISKLLSNELRFATTATTPWQSALKYRLMNVAIRGTIIFFVAIRGAIFFRGNPCSKYRGVPWSAVHI